MVTSEARLTFKENVTFSRTLESVASKEIGRLFETLVSRPFLKIGLTIANLKGLGNLFKDIESLQISVTGLSRTGFSHVLETFQEACQSQQLLRCRCLSEF